MSDSERFGLALAVGDVIALEGFDILKLSPDQTAIDLGRIREARDITPGRYQVGLLESYADSDPIWYTKQGASWRADMLSRRVARGELYAPAVGVWELDNRMFLVFIYYDGMEFRPS